jgi:hypothetical protein
MRNDDFIIIKTEGRGNKRYDDTRARRERKAGRRKKMKRSSSSNGTTATINREIQSKGYLYTE